MEGGGRRWGEEGKKEEERRKGTRRERMKMGLRRRGGSRCLIPLVSPSQETAAPSFRVLWPNPWVFLDFFHTHPHPTSQQMILVLYLKDIHTSSMVTTSVTVTVVHLSHLERLTGPALDLSESPSQSPHHAVLIQEGNCFSLKTYICSFVYLLCVFPLKMYTKEGICIFYSLLYP